MVSAYESSVRTAREVKVEVEKIFISLTSSRTCDHATTYSNYDHIINELETLGEETGK